MIQKIKSFWNRLTPHERRALTCVIVLFILGVIVNLLRANGILR